MALLWFFIPCLLVYVHIVELVPVTWLTTDSKDITKEDLIKAREYIERFYNVSTASRRMTNPAEEKIKAMQTFFGLNVTGKINKETLQVIRKPRCGVPDVQRFSLFPGKPKWEKTALTYRIVNYTPDITSSEVDYAIAQALRLWGEVTPLNFRQIYSGEADIMLSFGSRNHGDFFPFDGPLGILAHAFAPGDEIGGDAHFDEEETWTLGLQGTNIFLVALHELGHALGLEHSRSEQAIMYPMLLDHSLVDPTKFKLFRDDIEGIQALYGPRMSNGPKPYPPEKPLPRPTIKPQPNPPKQPPPKPPKEPQPKPPKDPQPKPPKDPQPKPPKDPQPKPPKDPQPKPPKEPQPKPPKEPQPKPPKDPQPKPPKDPQPKPPKEPQPKPPKEPQPKPPKDPQPKPPKEPQPKPPKEPQPKPPKDPQPKPPKDPQPKPPKEPQPKPPKEPQPKPPKDSQPKPPKEPQPKPPKDPQPKPPKKPQPKPTKRPDTKPTLKPQAKPKPTKGSKPDVSQNPTAPRRCDKKLEFDAITPMRGNLLFFKEGIIWRKSATKSNIDTILINGTWPKIRSIDAAYEVPQRDIVYLFKGQHFWITRGFSLVQNYPQDISQFGFPSSVKKIDAALFLKEEKKAIFFVGDKYWSYDHASLKMDPKSPGKIKKGFPGIGERVEAAFQDNAHLYFSNGANQVEYSPWRKRVTRKIPNYQWLDCNRKKRLSQIHSKI